ncbi:alpha/beta hydrolase [Pseudomonas caspiana]|uniref:Lipase n=1 Tax=Pseudomonas caspiana TaxID=1451454 RepID=A0A1Y3PCK1_9PSED|nr:alpha/beta hydrolase [Pseudomonas caspiana]OUM74524.1 lipase [Pseudomonas caspiana]
MPVHPDLAAFLEMAEFGRLSGSSKPLHELTPVEARETFELTSELFQTSLPEGVQAQALQLPARQGSTLSARLYRKPCNEPDGQPVLLFFHGGGYVVGSLQTHDSVCAQLAAASGWAVLAADYRLAPEHIFPAAFEDAEDAVNAIPALARDFALNAARVVFAGDSVGASLAASLAIQAVRQDSPLTVKPVAQLLFYPVADMSREQQSHRTYAEGYLLESLTLQWFYRQYCPDPASRLDWRASPLLARDIAGVAPAYVSLAEFDPLYDEGVLFAEHLKEHGVPVHLETEPGLTHDFLRMTEMVATVPQIYRRVGQWLQLQG